MYVESEYIHLSATPHIHDSTLQQKSNPTDIIDIHDTYLAPKFTLPDYSPVLDTPARSVKKVSAHPHSLIG